METSSGGHARRSLATFWKSMCLPCSASRPDSDSKIELTENLIISTRPKACSPTMHDCFDLKMYVVVIHWKDFGVGAVKKRGLFRFSAYPMQSKEFRKAKQEPEMPQW